MIDFAIGQLIQIQSSFRMSQQASDEEKEFQPIKDEWAYEFVVSKANERKIIQHIDFEAVCSKYWALVLEQDGADRSKNSINQKQYTELMKRMLKVLLPLYRENEMAKEIAQEWLQDSCGEKEMSMLLFQKMLFKIAHLWATHVDIKEYIELLSMVYDRITTKKVIRGADGSCEVFLPRIQVEIFQEEKGSEDEEEWVLCGEDSDDDTENWDYEWKDDDNGVPRKVKRKKAQEDDDKDIGIMNARDPFEYFEHIQYFTEDDEEKQPSDTDYECDVFAQMCDVYPFGYATEQYLTKLKNDVHESFVELKEQKRKALEDMKRQLFEGNATSMAVEKSKEAGIEKDPGLIEEQGFYFEEEFKMHDHLNGVRIKTIAHIRDSIYNQLRLIMKNESNMAIRPKFEFPNKAILLGKANMKIIGSNDHQTDVNTFLYNPALERRIAMKMIICEFGTHKVTKYINVNYLIVDPVYDTAYRSDVRRVETSEKMSIKPVEDSYVKEEEFNHVTTCYREIMKIMISKKFETLYSDKLQKKNPQLADRAKKIHESETIRKQQARFPEHLTAKGIDEINHEIKTDDLRTKYGPFYQYISKEGILEDDFVNCGTMDLIDYANRETMKILIIGKPRCGKSTLAQALCKQLDLVRISADTWVEDFLFRIKDRIENPPDIEPQFETKINEETGEEEQIELPPPEWRTALEKSVQDTLNQGQKLHQDDINEMIRLQLHSNKATTKGFVLDLDFAKSAMQNWCERLQKEELLQHLKITHVIEIVLDDEEIQLRARGIRQNVATGQIFSKWERDELRKPKPKRFDENGELIVEEEEEEDETKVKLPEESELVTRTCDEIGNILSEIDHYSAIEGEHKAAAAFIDEMYDSTYVKIDAAGLDPTELCDAVSFRVNPKVSEPLRPVAKIIEGGGDFKSLLTDEGNEEEGILPRVSQWSLWKTTDPVALMNGQVEQGIPDFAVHYANNVFVFQTEENMKEFADNPRKFLCKSPEMPPNFRVLMMGPKGVGTHTQARKLEDLYNWRTIDFNQIVKSKLNEIMKMRDKPPNNPVEGTHLNISQDELDKIKEGQSMPAWKFLPWILHYLGIPLQRKPIVPKAPEEVPDEAEMNEAEKKAFELAKKKKQAEEKKKADAKKEAEEAKKQRDVKRDEARAQGIPLAEIGLEETEEEIIIEDLPLEQLTISTQPREDGTIPKVERIIMIGFPQSEVHVEKLKEYGFGFDRLLFLTDLNEEDAGKEVTQRNTRSDGLKYDWEAEAEAAQKILTAAQEIMTTEDKPGEEKVVKIDCNGSIEDVLIKIRTSIDPFFLKPDNAEDVRISADLEEDDDGNKKNLPRSDFGDYCPVTFVEEGFMVKGDPEKESLVMGKTYLFASDKEQEKFNKNPRKYMLALEGKASLPLQPPLPKIMLIGNRGSGVTTQIRMLCDKFKLEEFELQKEFLEKVKTEKEKRQRLRLLQRGYKALPIDEDTGLPEADPEILDDPPEFTDEIDAHEKRYMAEIIDSNKGLICDGHWTTLPEDTVSTSLQDLLNGSKRMPEIVIVLKCKEESTFTRTIFKEKIKAEFDEIMEKRKVDIEKKRAEARKAEEEGKLEELKAGAEEETTQDQIEAQLAEHMKGWDEEEKEKEPNEYLEEEAPVFEEMLEKQQEQCREQLEKDNAFIEEFVEALKEKRVEVVENLNTDISAEYVHIKLVDKLKGHLKYRKDLIEREQAIALKPKEVHGYEQSYTYRHSKFGLNSPISPFNPMKTKNFAVLYRERIYFLQNAEEQALFLLEPSKYVKGVESCPNDLLIKPKLVVLGLPKSGKSELCQTLSDKIGVIHLKIEDVIEDYVGRESSFCKKISDLMKGKGREIDDLFTIQLLIKRLERRDCRENGWVIEDFPKTRVQAKLMAQRGLMPQTVINLNIPISEVYKRTEEFKDSDFGCNREVLKKRLCYLAEQRPKTLYFYQKFYNSVVNIDALKSRWFIQDLALEAIQCNVKAKLSFARDFFHEKSDKRPCLMEGLNIARELMKASISQYGYFCPVSFKMEKSFKHSSHLPELAILYKQQFYYFSGPKEREIFRQNPSLFTEKIFFSSEKRTPILLKSWKASELISNEKELQGYCSVSLKDEERMEQGNQVLIVKYDNKNFVFANTEKARKFFSYPHKYFKTQLPVKMPPKKEDVGLYQLSRQEKSITFLEQALGSCVTKGLREVGESRLKYPTLSIKETSLKLFALYLKCENPANTTYMKEKYLKNCQEFLEICTISEELYELADEKEKKQAKGRWPQFKEDYYNELGRKYDQIMIKTEKDKVDGFWNYMK